MGAVIPLSEIEAARRAIAGKVLRTPLARLAFPEAGKEIWLKLENLQPIASFKIRGAVNAFSRVPRSEIESGVLTASAGNWAQGLAWAAREASVPCTIIVPEYAPKTKLAAIERLGARYIKVPFDRWWQCMTERRFEGVSGRFFHPVEDEPVMAGNGTIGLEILEDRPDVEAVLVPWGGGGLATGIASALRQLAPKVKIYAVEVETAAPLAPSLAAGEVKRVSRRPSFVDGIGSETLLPKMWPFARDLLNGAHVVSVEAIANAVRLLVERNRVVAEGAGASSVAAALSGRIEESRIACVVSGGNLDTDVLCAILSGRTP
jgi:threonine dehydratase